MEILFIIVSTIVFANLRISNSQILVATQVSAKLTDPTIDHFTLYDQNDTIYILGGDNTEKVSRIYSYSISQDRILELATFPEITSNGFAAFNEEGDIFYMGGHKRNGLGDGNIYKLETQNWNLSVVEANQTFGKCRGIGPMAGTETILIPGGHGYMYCFDLSTLTSCGGTKLLSGYNTVRPFIYGNYVYLTGSTEASIIEILHLETLESELNATQLPYLEKHDVVFDGTFAYILGLTSGSLRNGIIRFDPETFEHEFFPVENFPINHTIQDTYWRSGSAVYVEKLNRIYFAGGFSFPGIGLRDEIWYIDLAPLSETPSTTEFPTSTTMNPDIFTCTGKPQGLYPNPYDCAKFIGCRNQTEEFYECPYPLLFSPILLACTFPEDVECDISCFGKPDGMYVHPHDCSLFIGCHNEVVEVYKCPAPLLFDPQTKQCNFPEIVQCHIED